MRRAANFSKLPELTGVRWLFVAEGDQGIRAGSAARWEVAGGCGDGDEDGGDGGEGERVGGANAEEQGLHGAREEETAHDADGDTEEHGTHAFAEDETEEGSA